MKLKLPSAGAMGLMFILGYGTSAATAETCALALVLALDASKSMTSADYDLAFKGTAQALKDDDVQAAILAQGAPVALSAFEWSGQHHQEVVQNWSILRTPEDIDAVAESIAESQRQGIGQKTGTGSALGFAYALLDSGPDCSRQVVDVASDGYSSDGVTPAEFYARHPAPDIVVNALVVGGKSRPHLWRYFNTEVIRGSNAFSMATVDFEDFPAAMKEKLLRELTMPQLTGTPAPINPWR